MRSDLLKKNVEMVWADIFVLECIEKIEINL